MSVAEQVITILMAVLATMLTRFLTFLLFRDDKSIPIFIKKLGDFLPPVILGMLVLYCYRDVIFSFNTSTLISLVAGILTAISYLWKKDTLLSIAAGTICYMSLIYIV